MRHLRYVLIVIVCVGMSFGIVFAQDDALKDGTVRGLVTDLTPAQNPIESVEVKIVAQDDGKEFTTKTDVDGNYEHAGLPAGRYLISISKEGYDERGGKPVMIVNGGVHFVPLKMRQKGNIEPFFEVQRDGRMNLVVKHRIVSLLERIAEGIGKRYDLDKVSVKTLHRSILDSIESALELDGDMSIFTKSVEEGNMSLIETVFSHPGCQAVFAKHLSEVQFKDYTEFTAAWRQRDRQVVVHWIAATLDKELSLRADQREKVVQSLLKVTENELFPTSMNALRLRPQQAAQLTHYRLKVSLDGVLSEAQSQVWEGLVNAKVRAKHIVIVELPKVDVKMATEDEKEKGGAAGNKKRPFIRKDAPKFVNIEKTVNIVIDEIDMRRMQLWNDWDEVNPAESEAQMKQTAEAKLAAHTELLGTLNERATRRLALVAKGVVQQYFEAHEEVRDALSRKIQANLRQKVEDGKMTRKEAAAMLEFTVKNVMTGLHGSEGMQIDITEYPLYQQAIKEVLSEEAFARYSEHQVERAVLYQQALRDVVVGCLDTQLLLDNTQREVLETSASQLIPAPLEEKRSSGFMFFQLFPQTVDFEILTPWQRREFERIFSPMVWRR